MRLGLVVVVKHVVGFFDIPTHLPVQVRLTLGFCDRTVLICHLDGERSLGSLVLLCSLPIVQLTPLDPLSFKEVSLSFLLKLLLLHTLKGLGFNSKLIRKSALLGLGSENLDKALLSNLLHKRTGL